VKRTLHALAAISLLGIGHNGPSAGAPGQGPPHGPHWMAVSGTGVHMFTSAIVHTQTPTASGMIQTSTDTVELTGDLKGRILYHPTSVFDFANNTLLNTGHQVFSGTVLGSEPTLLLDEDFRFEVDLQTGATVGTVSFTRTLAGPRFRCLLDVVGTGITPDGDAAFAYTGQCRGV
jgi:hypothetical protein